MCTHSPPGTAALPPTYMCTHVYIVEPGLSALWGKVNKKWRSTETTGDFSVSTIQGRTRELEPDLSTLWGPPVQQH